MKKVTLVLLAGLICTSAFAKKVVTPKIIPRTYQLTCPPNPEISLQCNGNNPVNCYVWSGALVTEGWASTPLLSTGMPQGFSMPSPQNTSPKAVFNLVGGSSKQGTANLARCSYSYTFNGTVTFDAVRAYTPPDQAICQFVLSKRAIICL